MGFDNDNYTALYILVLKVLQNWKATKIKSPREDLLQNID